MLKRIFRHLASDRWAAPSGPDVLVNAYATVASLPPLDFPHTPRAARSAPDTGLADHLQGFSEFVMRDGSTMTQARYHLLMHLKRVRHQASLLVPESAMDAFSAWAARANAISFFPDASIRDPAGLVLLGGDGSSSDFEARVPHPADAWARKTRSESLLAERGLKSTNALPPRDGESEARFRPAAEVWGRTRALTIVGVRAESIRRGNPVPVESLKERLPDGFANLSADEHTFLRIASPDTDDLARFGARFEAARALAWALGLEGELPFPAGPCDGSAVARQVIDATPPGLRATPVLLDALDLHHRLHWVVRQAYINGRNTVAGVDGAVVAERCRAFNWLVQFKDAAWDEVDTPT
ncbi:MAG: DUF4272 domain-containing protein [Rhizobacter sp.]